MNTDAPTIACATCGKTAPKRTNGGRPQKFCSSGCRFASYAPEKNQAYHRNIKNGLCGSCGKAPCGANSECDGCLKRHRDKARVTRIDVITHYGGKCACPGCAEARFEFLAIDHIDGGGNAHRRAIGMIPMEGRAQSVGNFTQWLRRNKYPPGFRVLCHNCNAARGYYGYCPHEKEN